MSEVWMIRSTFAKKDEAISVARALLEDGLIACANIDEDMIALFRWEGLIQQEPEVILLAKTTKEKRARVMQRIKEMHSYQVPSILAWPVGNADAEFAAWVAAEVS